MFCLGNIKMNKFKISVCFAFFLILFACGEVDGNLEGTTSSSSSHDEVSSSSSSSETPSSSSSLGFEIVDFEWVAFGNMEISDKVLTTESVTWFEAKEIADSLNAFLPTVEQWEDAATAGIIEMGDIFDEWTSSCIDNDCYRKSFNNDIYSDWTTPKEGVQGLPISFRVIRNKQ